MNQKTKKGPLKPGQVIEQKVIGPDGEPMGIKSKVLGIVGKPHEVATGGESDQAEQPAGKK